MFSDRMKRRFSRIALAGAALAMPVAAMAGVVVKSSGPSASTYKVGTKLDDDATITLKAGDSVTVLTSKGTRVMKGAGTFRVGEKPKEPRMRFANFTRRNAAGRVRTGAVRTGDTGGPATRPNMWYVDVTQPGTTCLYDFDTVRMWRPDTSEAATYILVEPEHAEAVEVNFEATEPFRVLNSERVKLAEDRVYVLRKLEPQDEETDAEEPADQSAADAPEPAEPETVRMSFALIGEYDRPDQLAEMLIAKGCDAQLAIMTEKLEADAL